MRPKPRDVIVTTVRLPRDIQAWLRERGARYGGSHNAELVRFCRLAMEKAEAEAAAKARRSAAATE
jgi:hypothetical protein